MPAQTEKPIQEKVLVSWMAPSRPFKKRSRDFYITMVSIGTLIGVVLLLIEGIMPVLLLVGIGFLAYVLFNVKPEEIEYQVTNLGIRIAGQRMEWNLLGRFWFTNRLGADLLIIEANNIAGRIEVVVSPEIKGQLEKELKDHLVKEEIPPAFFDKAASWVSKKLPTE